MASYRWLLVFCVLGAFCDKALCDTLVIKIPSLDKTICSEYNPAWKAVTHVADLPLASSMSGGDGCRVLTPSDVHVVVDRVALVYRGGCSFADKAINVFNAGAAALIIINNASLPLVSIFGFHSFFFVFVVLRRSLHVVWNQGYTLSKQDGLRPSSPPSHDGIV